MPHLFLSICYLPFFSSFRSADSSPPTRTGRLIHFHTTIAVSLTASLSLLTIVLVVFIFVKLSAHVMMQYLPSALSLLLPAAVRAQTTVGCDPTCPPLGYESDSSHLCTGSTVDDLTSSRLHEICHPTDATLLSNLLPYSTNIGGNLPSNSNNKLSFDAFKMRGHVTVIANYYTGCEAGRRESGVYAGIAQRIHDETNGLVNFVVSIYFSTPF